MTAASTRSGDVPEAHRDTRALESVGKQRAAAEDEHHVVGVGRGELARLADSEQREHHHRQQARDRGIDGKRDPPGGHQRQQSEHPRRVAREAERRSREQRRAREQRPEHEPDARHARRPLLELAFEFVILRLFVVGHAPTIPDHGVPAEGITTAAAPTAVRGRSPSGRPPA
jgi:hypothetical protein